MKGKDQKLEARSEKLEVTKSSIFNLSSISRNIRIATRKSDLALWQANWVREKLEALGHTVDLVLIETKGDKTQSGNKPFAQISGQGFFTKAVQDAVLDGRADMAVHSHKDLPSALFDGLEVAAVTKRADPRDVLLVRKKKEESPSTFNLQPSTAPQASIALRKGATVGTSAVRRQKQLLALRPDLEVKELRGNVPTRVQKLRNGDYDAIVLAAAGLERLELDLSDLSVHPLEPSVMMPAPAQGVLALETRRDSYDIASILTELHDNETYKAVAAERGLMSILQGGCQLALGAYATYRQGMVNLSAWYEGQTVNVQNPSSENAAMLAFDALGRPTISQ